MFTQEALLYWLIIGCEAAFWFVLLLGLAARYLLRREGLSRVLLFSLPAVDLLLLAFTAMDLKGGTVATFAHGLATAYVGFTVAFGAVVIRWADQRFAHRFAAGPPPVAPPTRGWPAVRYEVSLWLLCLLAWIIAAVLLLALIVFVSNPTITEPLHRWFGIAAFTTIVWFVFGPLWRLVFFRGRNDMSKSADPVLHALTQYKSAAYHKDVSAFVALYTHDVHVFDMWNRWELRGIEAWRNMAEGWFKSLGEERVVVGISDVVSTVEDDLALGHATLTYTAMSAEGKELRSLDNRITIALRRTDGMWKVFHEHTSGPIDHSSLKGMIKRGGG
jgi:ketosteroid isomerase-like protein